MSHCRDEQCDKDPSYLYIGCHGSRSSYVNGPRKNADFPLSQSMEEDGVPSLVAGLVPAQRDCSAASRPAQKQGKQEGQVIGTVDSCWNWDLSLKVIFWAKKVNIPFCQKIEIGDKNTF